MTYKLLNGGTRAAGNDTNANDKSSSAALSSCLLVKLKILPKIFGVPDFPFELEPRENPARLCLLAVVCFTCAGYFQLLGSEACEFPDSLPVMLEFDPPENQNSKEPVATEMQLKASSRARLSGTNKYLEV